VEYNTDNYDADLELWDKFQTFIKTFNKVYVDDEEMMYRYSIFMENVHYVNNFNAESTTSLRYGITAFMDLRKEEFNEKLISGTLEIPISDNQNFKEPSVGASNSVDWRQQGIILPVSAVNAQTMLVIAATENIASIHALNSGNAVAELSYSQLLNCSNFPLNGSIINTYRIFDWVKQNGGLDTVSSFVIGRCEYSGNGAHVSSYYSSYAGSESTMESVISKYGPVTACLDAQGWQFYSNGIYYSNNCNTSPTMCALVVGYGYYNQEEYWIVKNWWGSSWGMQGYIWAARNKNNNCGIASDFSIPSTGGG